MAGGACKIIINGGVGSLSMALETILTDPTINMGKIPERDRREMIQRLADCDTAMYSGGEMPKGGLTGIMLDLAEWGLVSDDVWKVYARPAPEYSAIE